jgi:hypothetical protein
MGLAGVAECAGFVARPIVGHDALDGDAEADFADTAALVANLDLVIAVDTAVAHLAAALGKPVWLLDRYDPCWRWLQGRQDCPWYPSLRLFRQQAPGDWLAVIEEVKGEMQFSLRSLRTCFTTAASGPGEFHPPPPKGFGMRITGSRHQVLRQIFIGPTAEDAFVTDAKTIVSGDEGTAVSGCDFQLIPP